MMTRKAFTEAAHIARSAIAGAALLLPVNGGNAQAQSASAFSESSIEACFAKIDRGGADQREVTVPPALAFTATMNGITCESIQTSPGLAEICHVYPADGVYPSLSVYRDESLAVIPRFHGSPDTPQNDRPVYSNIIQIENDNARRVIHLNDDYEICVVTDGKADDETLIRDFVPSAETERLRQDIIPSLRALCFGSPKVG